MTVQLIDDILYSLNSVDLTASVANNQGNNALPIEIVIPQTVAYSGTTYKVISIEKEAFYGKRTITSITLNDNILKIGQSAFDNIRFSLDLLTLPSSLQEIDNYAFASNDIKRVIIPSVRKIGYCPFGNNLKLESIEVDQRNHYFCKDYQYALYDKKQTRLIRSKQD